MDRRFVIIAFLAAFLIPAAAPSATGMAAMQYYVGSWSCTGGTPGKKPSNATLTYTLDNGLLREWISVPAQGTMKTTYVQSSATTYDAKNGRYVDVDLANNADWTVSYAKPWTGNVEVWMDHANSSGKLGRGEATRVNQNEFTYNGYSTAGATNPDFKATCRKSM